MIFRYRIYHMGSSSAPRIEGWKIEQQRWTGQSPKIILIVFEEKKQRISIQCTLIQFSITESKKYQNRYIPITQPILFKNYAFNTWIMLVNMTLSFWNIPLDFETNIRYALKNVKDKNVTIQKGINGRWVGPSQKGRSHLQCKLCKNKWSHLVKKGRISVG